MKHILLPTDFSENAWNAMFTALKLYADVPCTFYVLNVYELKIKNILGNRSTTRAGMVHNSLQQESHKELENILKYIKENHFNLNHSFETISKQDDLASAIKQLVHEKDLDLIMMGTKGATGAKRIFMGSNTVRVIKSIRNCAILAVPDSFNFQTLKTIVFPTEYAHFFSKKAFSVMAELVRLWRSKILIFHVAQEFNLNENQQTNKKILKERLKNLDYSFHNVNIKSTVAKAISNYSEENKADLLVLIHYEHTFMEKLTQEPVVTKVGFNTQTPLLILPETT